ncbi:MAG: hypothetical protein ACTIAS_06245 [Pseudomonas helleri]|uniref:hypothetical protein n=1 Tax=Pseudomonas helleri TaxID=1608996 RepID=UPI003F9E2838
MSDRSELKRLAETAPSGPWRYWGETANEIFQCSGKRVLIIAHDQSVPACEFIAAANPAAVLSLISDYDSALTQVAALREELAAAAWIIKETLGKDASDLRVQLADANPAAVLSLISDYDSALTQVAALREELAAAAWIIKETLGKDASDLRVQLADAERRNAELIELLRMIDKTWNVQDPSDDDRACWVAIDAAINPKPEASSHEN